MRWWSIAASALGLAACAGTPSEMRRDAKTKRYEAEYAARRGDYALASKREAKADSLDRRASERERELVQHSTGPWPPMPPVLPYQ